MHRAYKYRIYPTIEQAELINKNIGCSRFIYNHFLALSKADKYLGYNEHAKRLTILKKAYPFLKEVESTSLQQTLRDLDSAYSRFFKKLAGFPKFKDKRNPKQSYRSQMVNSNIQIRENHIKLPKLGFVKFANSRELKGKILNVTISRTNTYKYYISICVDTEIEIMPRATGEIGIDLGLKDYLVTSDSLMVPNPKYYRKYEKQLGKAQRRLSKKKKDSNNYNKEKLKVALLHEKIAHTRRDFLHKQSTAIVAENQTIVVEGLKPGNMIKNKRLSKSIADASWGIFLDMLEYKSLWYDRKYIKINPFFPSSQLCSSCGHQNINMKKLYIRTWVCPICGEFHHRDVNAAKNIKAEGLRVAS